MEKLPAKEKLSDDEITIIQECYAQGQSMIEIQDNTKYSLSTISKYVNEEKPGKPGNGKKNPNISCKSMIFVINASNSIPTKVRIWNRTYVLEHGEPEKKK